jgi:DNA-binding winged helix-turn-helix (wHTH) protein
MPARPGRTYPKELATDPCMARGGLSAAVLTFRTLEELRTRGFMTDPIGTSPGAGCENEILAFGPFRLDPRRPVLQQAGQPVRVGSRALELLIVLVERAGETVSTDELLARVWPSEVRLVTLRAHIASLRKILGDGKPGTQYVESVYGRGYRFAAPVTRLREVQDPARSADNSPVPMMRMAGRAQGLSTLAARVPQRGFVAITGAGGVGKITLAPTYPHGVCFVDLPLLSEPRRISDALAAALGLVDRAGDDPLAAATLTFLQEQVDSHGAGQARARHRGCRGPLGEGAAGRPRCSRVRPISRASCSS